MISSLSHWTVEGRAVTNILLCFVPHNPCRDRAFLSLSTVSSRASLGGVRAEKYLTFLPLLLLHRHYWYNFEPSYSFFLLQQCVPCSISWGWALVPRMLDVYIYVPWYCCRAEPCLFSLTVVLFWMGIYYWFVWYSLVRFVCTSWYEGRAAGLSHVC
jgi:hypothetical protein